MAFNKKLNVVKYFLLCFAFMLPILSNSSVSAIRKNVYGTRIYNLSYATQYPSSTITDLSLISGTYHPLTNISIPAGLVFNISRFKGKFAQPYNIVKNKKWSYEISVIVGYKDYAGQGYEIAPIPQAQCPIGDSGWVIDDCQVSIENFDGNVYSIYPSQGTGSVGNSGELNTRSYIYNRWIIKLKGHWKNNNATVDYFETIGAILSIYNPSPLAQDIDYSFAMPTFYFFDEEESAQDEAAQKELEGTSNIEDQSSSDIGGSTSQQTTSLIGTISNFVSAFSNISPSANCNLTLPFPEFLGGDTTVNICQGKDKAPTLIAAGSSLLLIVTFVPLAFIMLKMIYSEIRSFTNG